MNFIWVFISLVSAEYLYTANGEVSIVHNSKINFDEFWPILMNMTSISD